MMVLIEELFQQWDFSITLSAITLLFWNVETSGVLCQRLLN